MGKCEWMDSVSHLYGVRVDDDRDPSENVRLRTQHATLQLVVRDVNVETDALWHSRRRANRGFIVRYRDARP